MTRGGPGIGPAALGLLLGLSLCLSGCGSTDLSSGQLHSRASSICSATARLTGRIRAPSSPQGGAAFLSQGIAVLGAELAQLRALHTQSPAYRRAVTATDEEVKALQFALKGLRTGNDPVVTIKTLEQRLAPLQRGAAAAWRSLRIPKCVAR